MKSLVIIETGDIDRHSLTGKTAVITGAGGGIGYEAARPARYALKERLSSLDQLPANIE